jgi:glycosyltransferase involved in cell wall biosynthesis
VRRRDNRDVSDRSSQIDELGAGLRAAPVVLIVGGGEPELLAQTVRHALATTSEGVRVVVYGAEAPAVDLGDRAVFSAGGTADSTAAVLAAAGSADLVLLAPGVGLPTDWLPRLSAAAYATESVATASGLCDDRSLSRSALSFIDAAAAVAANSLGLHPRLDGPVGPCVYVRASALELAGPEGLIGSALAGGAFAERCVAHGLSHVLADDLLLDARAITVSGYDGGATGGDRAARARGAARRALTQLRVMIDARAVGDRRDGTRVHVLELIAALGRNAGAQVTALVAPGVDSDTRAVLDALPGVKMATVASASASAADEHPIADIVHRPVQISAPADLASLAPLGPRLVITHQDLISFQNPAYFRSQTAWTGYRDLTRRGLAAADHVVFFSTHARQEALAEDLVEPQRATVIPIGVDHQAITGSGEPVPPPGATPLGSEAELLLCLGTDFQHKNRVFALKVALELQLRHGWSGWLVLAGPDVAHGSSRQQEDDLLVRHPELARRILHLGAVSDAEKNWLLGRARLVLYPTVQEGFGLIPFEAADHGVPCLWAAGSALSEVLPDEAASIVAWDAAATAGRALELIRDNSARTANLGAIHAAGERLRWDHTANRLIELYREVCRQPPAPAAALERTGGLMRGGLSEDAMRLVGPDGSLPSELERPLLALTTHRRLAGPVLGLIRAGYMASRRTRRARRGQEGEAGRGGAEPD